MGNIFQADAAASKMVTLELKIAVGAVRLLYADEFVRAHVEYTVSAGEFVRARAVDFPVTGNATVDEVRAMALAQIELAEGLNG